LIFDFLNHRAGRLDPGYAAIANKAGCLRAERGAVPCQRRGGRAGAAGGAMMARDS
jgi:hypothetical protein